MKTIVVAVFAAMLFLLPGCGTTGAPDYDAVNKKIAELVDKYNTPENREKLIEAIEKLVKEMNDK